MLLTLEVLHLCKKDFSTRLFLWSSDFSLVLFLPPHNSLPLIHTMAFAIYVTEQVTNSYEFESREEAERALESGDFWHQESVTIDGEVLDTEIVELPGH